MKQDEIKAKYAVIRYALRTAQDLIYDAKFNAEEVNPTFADYLKMMIDTLDDDLVALRKLMEGLE